MSAQMIYTKYEDDLNIDDFMNGDIAFYSPTSVSILNMCLTNGTMGRSDQLKLRELYPNLFDEVQKFLARKNRGNVFIYEEQGKPKVVNVFIHLEAKNNDGNYDLRKSALKSIKLYVRNNKLPTKEFVWINDEERKHRKMIENYFKYQFGYDYKFIALREESTRNPIEEELPFI